MITVAHLSKEFILHILDDKRIAGCSDISFHVPPGAFLGLSGPSGVGKSTILKCIYRTYLATRGSIQFDSTEYGHVDLAKMPDRVIIDIRNKEMGYVSQFLRVIPRVSAIDVVMEPILARNGVSTETARKRSIGLLERLGIPSHLFDAYPATFSGGEQQRINIAHAVSWKPRLLLLDEPTASLDSGTTLTVLDILRKLREEGTTMIGIFHDKSLLETVSDAIYNIEYPSNEPCL